MMHCKLTVWIGPIASPTLFSFEKIALSKAGTIIPGLNVPKLPPAAFPLGHLLCSLAIA